LGKQDAVGASQPGSSHMRLVFRLKSAGLVVPKITPNKHERSRAGSPETDGHTCASLLCRCSFQKDADCAAGQSHRDWIAAGVAQSSRYKY
jgi:hypothetical protein